MLSFSLVIFAGCSGNKGTAGKSYAMGEAAHAGQLTYSILESEWKESLDGAMGQRLPKHRFLLISLNIANNGAEDVGVPFLRLIDANGAEFREEDKAEGVSSWLGYLRRVTPSEPLSGKILFDAPAAGYKLRISSGGAADTETTATVEIPYRADAPPVKSVEPTTVPSTK